MGTEREQLIDKLSKTVMVDIALSGEVDVEKIADFIIKDRKRIVEPLVKHYSFPDAKTFRKAVVETLKNAGLE